MKRTLRPLATASILLAGALLAGCSTATAESGSAPEPETGGFAEADSSNPRLVLSFDGGVAVLDARSLETLSTHPLEGFLRVNAAGDGRHVLVSTAEGFQVLDTGAYTEEHGDHGHHYLGSPRLTDVVFEAEEPGHVVTHGDTTVLFADGSGEVTSFEAAELADGEPELSIHRSPEPHHGVAVELADGSMLVTEGTSDGRDTIVALGADGEETTRIETCPGVHGEAMASGEVALFGCEDGVVVHRDGVFTKIDSPDTYGRIGNQRGSEVSTIVLGDYKSDPDAEHEHPTAVSLIDTETLELTTVELPASYSFRSLGRGPGGESLVLGTDGALHVIDSQAGVVTASLAVVDSWEEPAEWQSPRPTLGVLGGLAFVSEPRTKSLHVVDLTTLEVIDTVGLDFEPNELVAVEG